MTMITWRSDSLNILKRYQKMLQLQNSWKRCEFVRIDEARFLISETRIKSRHEICLSTLAGWNNIAVITNVLN